MAKRKNEVTAEASASDIEGNEGSSQSAGSTEDEGKTNGDELIKSVNDIAPGGFTDRYIEEGLMSYVFDAGSKNREVTLDFKSSADLSKAELLCCFALIERSSRADYEPSSFGWHPKRKQREMLEPEMRYLLIRESSPASEEGTSDRTASDSVAGFLSFMMTHDSSPSVPVLYVYEIHLEERLRGSGLGSHLMTFAESIAAKVGVEKVMLTCFLSNKKALNFYRARSYEKDVCSPDDRRTRKKVVKVDYVIMSKVIKHTAPNVKDNEPE